MSRIRSVKGLVAFVTGAASGLGKGTAELLVRRGAKVAIADLPSSIGSKIAQDLGEKNALFTPLDVSKETDVAEALKKTFDHYKRIDILVNCAALGMARATYNITEKRPNTLDDFERVLAVNVSGTFNVMRLGAEYLHRNEPDSDNQRGVIINTSGFAAFDGQQAQASYAATNGAVVSMTLPAARDLARLGIRVVTICPGLFDTALLSYLPDKVRTYLAEQTPSPARFGRPSEFGHLVQHIVENPYINGEVIRLDGGLRLFP